MKTSKEYRGFTDGLKKILKASPVAVKAAMEAEEKERAEERKKSHEQ